jgi:hypothetical protein
MAVNVLADFYSLIDLTLFDNAAVLMITCYLIWEIPRTIKFLSEEYMYGLYPEGGRVVDFALLVIGGLATVFLMMGNAEKVVTFLKKPGITSFFLIIMVVIPIIIILAYLKRFFPRFDSNSITVFIVQNFLDLMRTVFYVAVSILVIPVLGYLILGG